MLSQLIGPEQSLQNSDGGDDSGNYFFFLLTDCELGAKLGPIVPDSWEIEATESLEPKNSRLL